MGMDPAAVRTAWNAAADAYVGGQQSGRDYCRYAFFGPAQVALCGDVAGARLLDVACGGGYFARGMASRGARVTAVDISPRMIAHARRIESSSRLDVAYDVLAVDRYFERGVLAYDWKGWGAGFTTRAHHATLADWFAWILGAGFTLRAYTEPRPSDDALGAHPELEDAARVPYCAMFVVAR